MLPARVAEALPRLRRTFRASLQARFSGGRETRKENSQETLRNLLSQTYKKLELATAAAAKRAGPAQNIVRLHVPSERASQPGVAKFCVVPNDLALQFLRHLSADHVCAHAILPDNAPCDFFLDLELTGSSWLAAESSLAAIVGAIRAQAEEDGLGRVRRAAVFDACRDCGGKMSLHLHVRFERAFASRRDLHKFVTSLRPRVPAVHWAWVDTAPCLAGSLRIYQAVTTGMRARLRLLEVGHVKDSALRETLLSWGVAEGEGVPEPARVQALILSLLRRHFATDDPNSGPPAVVRLTQPQGQHQSFAADSGETEVEVGTAVANGELTRLLGKLDPECASDFQQWDRVMWLCCAVGRTVGESVAYEAFDDFSQRCPEKYDRRENRKKWDALQRRTANMSAAGALRLLDRMAVR